MSLMQVMHADDSTLFRRGLATLLTSLDIDVVADVATGIELLRAVEVSVPKPDAVIVDIRMKPSWKDEGLATAKELRGRYPHVGLLVLSTYSETAYAAQLLDIDTRSIGYLLKDHVADLQTLRDALIRIVAGECVIDPDIIARLLAQQRTTNQLDRLTERERDVLRLMAEGRSNARIANQLYLSPKTVETHVAALFTKLGFHPAADDNRRVLAVLTWLRATGTITQS